MAIAWCSNNLKGYDPEGVGWDFSVQLMSSDEGRYAWGQILSLWKAYKACEEIYLHQPETIERLQLASPYPISLHIGKCVTYAPSVFEAVYREGNNRINWLQTGDFFSVPRPSDEKGPDGAPFSEESIKARLPNLLVDYISYAELPPDFYHHNNGPPVTLEIVKEAQRTVGETPPFFARKWRTSAPPLGSKVKKETRDAIRLLIEGVSNEAIQQRLGMAAKLVNTIKYRYKDHIEYYTREGH